MALTHARQQKFTDGNSRNVQLIHIQELADKSEPIQKLAQLEHMVNNQAIQLQKGQHSENNSGLPDRLRSGIETLSGYAMDDVKVHYNSAEPAD